MGSGGDNRVGGGEGQRWLEWVSGAERWLEGEVEPLPSVGGEPKRSAGAQLPGDGQVRWGLLAPVIWRLLGGWRPPRVFRLRRREPELRDGRGRSGSCARAVRLVCEGAHELGAGALDVAGCLEAGGGECDPVEGLEGHAGPEEAFGVGQSAQTVVGVATLSWG